MRHSVPYTAFGGPRVLKWTILSIQNAFVLNSMFLSGAFLQIVSKRSATIGVANEDVVDLVEDHFQICRIKDENEKAYRRIVQDCQKLGMDISERSRCK